MRTQRRPNITSRVKSSMLASLPPHERDEYAELPTAAGRDRYLRVRVQGHDHAKAMSCGCDLNEAFEDLR